MSLKVGTLSGTWENKTPEGAALREVALVITRAARMGCILDRIPGCLEPSRKEGEESGL